MELGTSRSTRAMRTLASMEKPLLLSFE